MNFNNLMQKVAGAEIQPVEYDLTVGGDHGMASITENLLPYTVDQYPVNLYMDEDVSIRMTDLQTVIQNFVKSESAKFITGVRPLSEFEDYLKELNDIGYEEYTQICVDAYNAYIGA